MSRIIYNTSAFIYCIFVIISIACDSEYFYLALVIFGCLIFIWSWIFKCKYCGWLLIKRLVPGDLGRVLQMKYGVPFIPSRCPNCGYKVNSEKKDRDRQYALDGR